MIKQQNHKKRLPDFDSSSAKKGANAFPKFAANGQRAPKKSHSPGKTVSESLEQVKAIAVRTPKHTGLRKALQVLERRLEHEIARRQNVERAIVEISEREQRRIGNKLHETLAQQLTGSALAIKSVGDMLKARRLPEAQKLDRIAHMVNDGITQARELVQSLRPLEDDPAGLTVALRALAAQTNATRFCVFDCPKVVHISDAGVALHLYRIAQEAVENALLHTKAREIIISLCADEDRVVLKVRDDGTESRHNANDRESEMGLQIMTYRASIIAASLQIDSLPGSGTLVSCVCPLKNEA